MKITNQRGIVQFLPLLFLVILLVGVFAVVALTRRNQDVRSKAAGSTDVTASVELLGNPFQKGTYARNVWDMIVFNNKIYLGHGNSSNYGPDGNAGPIPIIAFDPTTNTFATEYTIQEEQINVYHIINGILTIPGHDPRGTVPYGDYYQLINGTWTQTKSIPGGEHTYDLDAFNNRLYAAVGPGDANSVSLYRSDTNGQTWLKQPEAAPTCRNYTVAPFNGSMYVFSFLASNTNTVCLSSEVRADGSVAERSDLNIQNLMPNTPIPTNFYTPFKVIKPVTFLNQFVYITGTDENDHQTDPWAAYAASSLAPGNVQAGRLTTQAEKPWDDLVNNGKLYILSSEKVANNQYSNKVKVTADLQSFSEVLRFTSDTFARSFVIYNGDYYFGLGCDVNYLPASCGNVLRVKGSAIGLPFATATPVQSIIPGVVIPAAPSNVKADGITSTSMNLTWADTVTNTTRFEVMTCLAGGTNCVTQTSSAGTPQTTVSNLKPSTGYWINVRACTSSGCSAYSSGIEVMTTALVSTPTPTVAPTATPQITPTPAAVTAVPSSPVSLRLLSPHYTALIVAWSDTANNETRFEVLVCKPGNVACSTQTFGANTTQNNVRNLQQSTSYWLNVRACNTAGCSPYSSGIEATTLP